jgi:anti-sigma-K factor RskA
MSTSDASHVRYAELAAGYALNALDHDEQQAFLEHAQGCPSCRPALAGFFEVAAALADLAPPAAASPSLGARILAAASKEPAGSASKEPAGSASKEPAGSASQPSGIASEQPAGSMRPAPGEVRGGPGRSRWLRLAAAAAAVVIAAGGVTWGILAGSGGANQPPAAACSTQQKCYQVVLTAASGRPDAATVVVRNGSVTLIPARLPPDDVARQIYVLWQITGAHVPVAVGSFDVLAGRHAAIRIGSLAIPFASTAAFAVSLEHGRTIPPRPSHPVALGQVPA